MEKRDLYVVVAVVVVAVIVLAALKMTGNVSLGNCIDSDGGDDKYVRGTAKYTGRIGSYTDECYARTTSEMEDYVKEYFCLDRITSKRYYCDKGCSDGACLK